jgi:4-amino-4-deoxy-L-arabinose transferase-like glycosyltransferase
MFLRRTLSDNICFILIALTALCLRFWLLISAKSIWGDEWFSIYLIEKPLSEIPALSIFTSNHPPGYLLILWAWAKLFGLQELSLRSMSHAFNLLMIVGVYKLAKELFNRKTAILTALFVGICPYFLHLSNEIRSYSTLTCLSVFATYFFFKAHNNPLHRTLRLALAVWHYGLPHIQTAHAMAARKTVDLDPRPGFFIWHSFRNNDCLSCAF